MRCALARRNRPFPPCLVVGLYIFSSRPEVGTSSSEGIPTWRRAIDSQSPSARACRFTSRRVPPRTASRLAKPSAPSRLREAFRERGRASAGDSRANGVRRRNREGGFTGDQQSSLWYPNRELPMSFGSCSQVRQSLVTGRREPPYRARSGASCGPRRPAGMRLGDEEHGPRKHPSHAWRRRTESLSSRILEGIFPPR